MHELSDFALKWSHPDYPPEPVSVIDIERAEAQLGARLPDDYSDAVLLVGLPRPTGALLHSICDQEADLADVAEFLTANEIVSTTQTWRPMGLPDSKIGFASDCMGNLFVFDCAAQSRGSEVWLFDHETGETSLVAPSFRQWVQQYLDLKFVPLDD